jgi:putative redox protein
MLMVDWQGGMAFESVTPSGSRFVMDSNPEHGGQQKGPDPVQALLAAAAACSGMDVVSILAKKRQTISRYRIEVDWNRDPEGDWPRPIRSIVLRHVIHGPNLDPAAVARAVELSDEKYCTVAATLRISPTITSEYRIEP